MPDKRKLGFFENFMLSGCAAATAKTATAPIERVKLLVQNQDEMIKQGRPDKPYSGIIDCWTRTMKAEGLGSFWRGNLANVLRYFPTQALNFAFKDMFKAMFAVPKTANGMTKFGANICSGGFAGSLSLLFVYSLDYCRTRMANDAKSKDGKRQFNGLIDCYKKTLASDGIGGLYLLYCGLNGLVREYYGLVLVLDFRDVKGFVFFHSFVKGYLFVHSGGGDPYVDTFNCSSINKLHFWLIREFHDLVSRFHFGSFSFNYWSFRFNYGRLVSLGLVDRYRGFHHSRLGLGEVRSG